MKQRFWKPITCFLFALNLLLVNQLSAQKTTPELNGLSFDQALRFAMENNFGIKQSNHLINQKEKEQQAAKGLYLPKISLSATYAFMQESIELDMTPVKDAITPLYETLGNYGQFSGVANPDPNTADLLPILPDDLSTQAVRGSLLEGLDKINSTSWITTIQEKQFGTVNANFAMPIYTGGKINAANRAAKIEVDEAHEQLNLKQADLYCEIVERYYGLVLANHALDVRQEVFETMKAHMEDAQKLKEQGMIADAEYLHAKVYFSEAERELKKSRRSIETVNNALLTTLSIDSAIQVIPVSQLFYTPNIESIDYFYQQAQNQSIHLKLVAHKKELAKQGTQVEKANYFPAIAAMGTYTLAEKDLSAYVPDYMVGVGLTWNIFDGASRLRKTQAAKFRENQAADYFNQTELNIDMAINKYYQELMMQEEQLQDLKSAYQFANEYFRVREKAFAEGMATTTEVSDASLALAKVKIEKLQAMYAYDVALSKLLYYTGITNQFNQYAQNTDTEFAQ
jgi:outer membrane protein TolC